MATVLTDSQALLVEKNHSLIFSFLKKCNLEIDDWYGVAALGLCNAARHFDPDRNIKFSSLAYQCMLNSVRMEMRSQRKLVSASLSLEDPISDIEDESLLISETVYEEADFRDAIAIRSMYNQVRDQFSIRDRNIIDRIFLHSQDQRSVASNYGISQAQISRICKKFSNSFAAAWYA